MCPIVNAAIDGETDLAGALLTATRRASLVKARTCLVRSRICPAVADASARQRARLLVSVFTEAVSLGLVAPPGEMGADIAVGEGQSIGNGLNFGGPYVGLFACRQKLVRQMPGRLVW